MTETKDNVIYQNGNRVETVTRTSTIADDAEVIGNRYMRLASLYRRKSDASSEQEVSSIESEIAKVKSEIDEYAGYLAGYDLNESEQ